MYSTEYYAGDTRFATVFIMIARIIQVRQALEETVVNVDWKEWVDTTDAALVTRADTVHDIVASNNFWKSLMELDSILK